MAAQLVAGSLFAPAFCQAKTQSLLNDSLPLPDMSIMQVEHLLQHSRSREGKKAPRSCAAPPSLRLEKSVLPAVTQPVVTAAQPAVTGAAPMQEERADEQQTLPVAQVEAPKPGKSETESQQANSFSWSDAEWQQTSIGLTAVPVSPAPATAGTGVTCPEALSSGSASTSGKSAETCSQSAVGLSEPPATATSIIRPLEAPTSGIFLRGSEQVSGVAVPAGAAGLAVNPVLVTPAPVPAAKPAPVGAEPTGTGPIVIDNDETVEQQETIKFEELPTDEGKTKIKTGARFPIVISSEITSKTAKDGDPVQGRLKYDLKIGDRLVAKKGSVVTGHITYSLKARTALHSLVSVNRWYRNSGCLGIAFDEIVNEAGEHIPLVAEPAQQALVVKNKGEGRVLGVNHKGQITGPWSQQLKYKAVRVGLNFALAPAGVFSFGAMPVALGVIGAANPSFAFMKPVGLNVRHRRLKGLAWGFLSGIPGSWLIEDTTVKGQEAVIKPGDEFLAEFRQEFTGEAATDAELLPNASTKVRGQVLTDTKKGKKK